MTNTSTDTKSDYPLGYKLTTKPSTEYSDATNVYTLFLKTDKSAILLRTEDGRDDSYHVFSKSGSQTNYIAVTNITNVPSSATKGRVLTLSGTVVPSDATNKTIIWSVKSAGSTGASISNENKLNTTSIGTVTLTASITNGKTQNTPFTKDFTLTINNPAQTDYKGFYAGSPVHSSDYVQSASTLTFSED